mgnify:CR=1 FL=1
MKGRMFTYAAFCKNRPFKVSDEEEGDERVLVLVTGSLHLAGAVLEVLQKRGLDINGDKR